MIVTKLKHIETLAESLPFGWGNNKIFGIFGVYLHFGKRFTSHAFQCINSDTICSRFYIRSRPATKTREGPKKVQPQARPIFSAPQPRIWPHHLISIHGVGIFRHVFHHFRAVDIWLGNACCYSRILSSISFWPICCVGLVFLSWVEY